MSDMSPNSSVKSGALFIIGGGMSFGDSLGEDEMNVGCTDSSNS